MEAPEIAALSQYVDRIRAAQTDMRVRRKVMSDPPTEPRLLQQVRAHLQNLGWKHEVSHMPDKTCPFFIDISLEQHLGKKVALIAGGRWELLQTGLPAERLQTQESGHLSLVHRVLACRGWHSAILSQKEWSAIKDSTQRTDFLEAAVKRALEGGMSSSKSP